MPKVLISGASTGIGSATALRLAKSGWTVFAGVRDPTAGERLVAEGGERIVPLTLDVTDSSHIAQAVELIADSGGDLDGLINNSGIGVGGPLETLDLDDWRRQFEINVFGTVAVTKAMLPALRKARGRIAIVSSVGGRFTTPFMGPYCGSKYALEAVGDSLRVELKSSGIQVTLIEPGSVATPLWGKGQKEIDRIVIPPELEKYYGHVPGVMSKALKDAGSRGMPADDVAAVIERTLNAKRIRARYLVGRDTYVMVGLKTLLPERAMDWTVRRMLKL